MWWPENGWIGLSPPERQTSLCCATCCVLTYELENGWRSEMYIAEFPTEMGGL